MIGEQYFLQFKNMFWSYGRKIIGFFLIISRLDHRQNAVELFMDITNSSAATFMIWPL